MADRCSAIREVLIAATDIIPAGDEPFVGWSAVLAERIDAALPPDRGAELEAELADERADRQAFHRHYVESEADAQALRAEHRPGEQ